ncbi:Acetyl esterase/lipase [Rhizobiales bacterium GAS113]|nr:Acetyl esterase/lipase [Rhizobiales bacterium GAS113]
MTRGRSQDELMPMDKHARRFLDMLAITGPKDATGETAAQRRAAYQSLMRLSQSSAEPCAIEDRVMVGPGGPLALRVYIPGSAPAGRLPGLVYFHGGGLVAGGLDDYDGICSALAAESGCRLVSVDYRLAPEHKFPAAVIDSYAATLWVAEHAAELGIDQDRIAVAGDSAGGGLAANVCQMAKQENGPELVLQLLLCPVLDCDPATPSRLAFGQGHLLDQATMDRDLAHYCPSGVDPKDPRLSPLRAHELAGLPQAQIHTAEFDPLRDEGKAYAERLALAGVKVNHRCHAGMIHHFYGMAGIIPYARTALRLIGAEVKSALA